MTAQQQGGPAIPFATFLILAAVGSFLWNTGPLDSSRPTSKDEGAYGEAREFQVPLRLWQDPFKSVYKEVHKTPPEESGLAPLINKIKIATDDGYLTVLGMMVTKGSYAEVEERRRRRRYAVLSGLAEAGFIPESAVYVQYLYLDLKDEFCPNSTQNESRTNDTGKNGSCKEAIPFEWYKKDEFSQQQPGEKKERVLVLWLSDGLFSKTPYKTFDALVKTLKGEDGLAKKLKQEQNEIEEVKGKVKEKEKEKEKEEKIIPIGEDNAKNISAYILGPARSEALKTMTQHAAAPKEHGYEDLKELKISGFHILSPAATVADGDLLNGKKDSKCENSNGEAARDKTTNDRPNDIITLIPPIGCGETGKTCVTFLRTISHDGNVIESLKQELIHRQIDPKIDDIALISEWDTSFGRALPRNFQTENGEAYIERPNIHKFSYLRGIDGRTVGTEDIGRATASNNKTKEKPSNALASADNSADIRRPVGTGQYDYLRRLAVRIKTLDASLKQSVETEESKDNSKEFEKSKKGIRAIGILGSDVYDKLLILRALRKSFPGIVFFTTDLDAQLLHPDEFYWARNLIVASSFDLQLNEKLQGRIPPFRDSYQTSIFFSTLLAVKAKINSDLKNNSTSATQDVINRWVQPQVLEVGRHGAVSLNRTISPDVHETDLCLGLSNRLGSETPLCQGSKVHPQILNPLYFQKGLALFFFAVIVIFTLHQIRPQSGLQVLWLGISLTLITTLITLVIYKILSIEGQEPFSFTEGISAWPTTFFRIATTLLAIYFVITALTNMQNNRIRLTRDFQLCTGRVFPSIIKDKTLIQAGKEFFRLPMAIWRVDQRVWSALIFSIGAFALMIATRTNFSIANIYWAILSWLVFIAVWYWYIYRFGNVRSINQWALQLANRDVTSVPLLWRSYCLWGLTKHRVYRSLTMAFIYMSFATIVFFMLPQDTNVWRGEESLRFGRIALMLAVFMMIFLIFFVVDATRLCICWIKAMGRKKLVWDEAMLKSFSEKLNVNPEYTREWLKIQLIAERTQEIGQLIYYPFVIIILMLISRSTYFDNWGFPQALAIVVMINLAILSSVAVLLRKQAEKVRQETIGNLEHELVKISGCRAPSGANRTDQELKEQKCHVEQINKLLEEIRTIKVGAFRSVLDQPLLRAGLILLGGLGLGLSEYSFLLW
jgi:hypothetical protein